MQKFHPDFAHFYHLGIDYKQKGEPEKAAQAHIKALDFQQDYPRGWHSAGAALLQIKPREEAIPYLQKALEIYEQKISEAENDTAEPLFWKAAVHALLQEKEAMLQTLSECFQNNPSYAEAAQSEEDFEAYREDEDFQKLIQEEMEALQALHYRGESLSQADLDPNELEARQYFVNEFRQAGWEVDEIEQLFAEEMHVSPQAMAEYCQNTDYCLRLSYHVDTELVFMELFQKENEEVQAFRLYYKKHVKRIIPVLVAHQDQLNTSNWMDMIKALIPQCQELLYEMPNGMKMRLGRM